jgi:alkaline phosphatase D
VKRRTFLSSIVAGVLASCSRQPSQADPPTTATASSTSVVEEPTTTAAAPAPTFLEPIEPPPIDLPDTAFGLGVASGDPEARSVVLWTRLDGVDADASVPIVWELAADDGFREIMATGIVDATSATGHAVHIVADGLEPSVDYRYRFRAGSLTSPVGRTRTLPAPGSVETVRIAVSSCQDLDRGAYAAHTDIAATENLMLGLWLGDFIYRRSDSLAGFRETYAEYRRNPQLQASQAACPWIAIPDDNEVADDYDASIDPTVRAAAYRAWWENQPTRLPEPTDADPGLSFHRFFDVGTIARIITTDSRQYADGTTLLGDEQLAFVEGALDHGADRTILASSVLMSGLRGTDEVLLPYTLDGYPDERRAIAAMLERAPSPLIVSGDLHIGMVLDFSANPADSTAPVVATELMAPAISSTFPEEFAPFAPFLPLLNPHIRHIDVANGWMLLQIDPDGASAEFRTVADVSDPSSPVTPTHRVDL